MSHRSKQAAMSRRTSRADQRQPPARSAFVSNNPIFFCEDESMTRLKPADLHRRHAEPGTVHALVLDDVPAAVGKPLPLPLPPSRIQKHIPAGSRAAGSTLVMSKHGSGWVLMRRVPRDDPFLAAYLACSKSGGGKVDAEPAKRPQNRKNTGDAVQGCGVWGGWAAGAKYAGAMSCKYGCDVARPAAVVQDSAVPRLHLSRQLVVIPARKRALARGRAQE
jgi:hypothetical protein